MKKAKTAKKTRSNPKAGKGAKSSTTKTVSKKKSLSDWRDDMLALARRLIQQADPEVVEEVKWRKPSNPAGVPVWSHDGIICTGERYKDKVKFTFFQGAALKDPARLFNSSLDGNARRAIDLGENDTIDEKAFKALIRDAVVLNTSAKTATRPAHSSKKTRTG